MADLCLVYARPNKERVRTLHGILAARYSVWWDQDIHSGNYRAEIERQIQAAKCVIPIWCGISRNDIDVLDEAEFARRHRIPLLPVRTEEVDPPLGFGSLHTVDLLDWDGRDDHEGIKDLIKNIDGRFTNGPRLLPRPTMLNLAGKALESPVFFRSVSSHETALQPTAALQALRLTGTEAILVSAYDIAHLDEKTRKGFRHSLEKCRKAGSIVLLDSGITRPTERVTRPGRRVPCTAS